MARRVFISYQHDDQMKAKGFHLLRWNKNVDVEFVGRHLLDPVKSSNERYVSEKIREQLTGTSVTVVLVGKRTSKSEWVAGEIDLSIEKGNGILAIRLESGVPTPQKLLDCGAEIIDWKPHEFADAIDRAALAARRAPVLGATGTVGGGCHR